ncbi:hypothetical protein E1B28_013397 [Marasmius oreades]|uniref:Uncharacterized protein n=1 Tax=Marasmius oreades TaxID=181124 RepID=A0A9P7RPI8_9AGAR|nr:uncharacterized protein E1B28_013397 [Marasmius oreades]KAG7087431.1 hypothetical protein E1B28_013397 [Marasmius oreades]
MGAFPHHPTTPFIHENVPFPFCARLYSISSLQGTGPTISTRPQTSRTTAMEMFVIFILHKLTLLSLVRSSETDLESFILIIIVIRFDYSLLYSLQLAIISSL